jgi:uncharacterized lipoprotein YmbA
VNTYWMRLALAFLASVGAACTSAPIRYYTLTAPSDETLPATAVSLAIDVRVIHSAPQFNRSELMIRTGPSEMTLLENERWVSPIKDEIKEAVYLELKRRLSQMTEWRPMQAFTKLSVDIDVQRLEAEPGRYALLEVSWSGSLSGAGSSGTIARSCTFRAAEEIRGGYAVIVERYQQEIAALAGSIVSVLAGSAGGLSVSCQTSMRGSANGSGSTDQSGSSR